MKHNNRYYRYSLCLFLIAGFFLTAWLINNWQSNKVNASFKPQSTMPNGIKIKAIQDIEVGERSIGKNPQLTDKERSEFFADPDPATWRKLTLTMTKPNGKRLDITLLRPLSWIEEVKAEQGGTIYLDLPEMGAVGVQR